MTNEASPKKTDAFVSPFAAVSQQATPQLSREGSVAGTEEDQDAYEAAPARHLSNPFPPPARVGSGGAPSPRRRAGRGMERSSATSEQEARVREAERILRAQQEARRPTPRSALSLSLSVEAEVPVDRRPSRGNQRRSLESFFALRLRAEGRSESQSPRPRAQPGLPEAEPAPSTTAANSLSSLSVTTRDIVDLETLRRMNLRPRQSMSLLNEVEELSEHVQPADVPDRQAFGLGAGYTIITPDGPPAQAVQRSLAFWAEESEPRQSWVPLLKTLPTFFGKLGVALGADMLTLGLSNGSRAFTIGGGVCIGTGIALVVGGMTALSRDMAKINKQRVPLTLGMTVAGMLITTGGLVVGEHDVGAKYLAVRACAAIVIGLGLTLLNTSMPLSFAYSELVHGDTFRNYRNEAVFALWGVGLGLATGLTLSRSAPRDRITPQNFPFGVAHASAVLGIAMATFGTCLAATNLQRTQGRLGALRTRLRRLADNVRQIGEGNSGLDGGRRGPAEPPAGPFPPHDSPPQP